MNPTEDPHPNKDMGRKFLIDLIPRNEVLNTVHTM